MVQNLKEVISRLKSSQGKIEPKPAPAPIPKPVEEVTDNEMEAIEDEEQFIEQKPEEKPQVKVETPKQPSQEEIVASEVVLFQNNGIYRRELLLALNNINTSLNNIQEGMIELAKVLVK